MLWGLVQVGRKKISWVIGDFFDTASDGDPVYMDIKNGHKDTHFYGSFAKGSIIIMKMPDFQYFSIRRCQYCILFDIIPPVRVPEKEDDKKANNCS